MGLDAVMYLVVPESLSDLELLRAGKDIKEFFFSDYEYVKDQCLHAEEDPLFDETGIIVLSKGERAFRVDVFDRYYGDGYERGYYPNIKLVSEFLERRFPGSRQFYGSDCSGVSAFSANDREDLWTHWCQVGRRPFFGTKS